VLLLLLLVLLLVLPWLLLLLGGQSVEVDFCCLPSQTVQTLLLLAKRVPVQEVGAAATPAHY
jgi:hypothetical protein